MFLWALTFWVRDIGYFGPPCGPLSRPHQDWYNLSLVDTSEYYTLHTYIILHMLTLLHPYRTDPLFDVYSISIRNGWPRVRKLDFWAVIDWVPRRVNLIPYFFLFRWFLVFLASFSFSIFGRLKLKWREESPLGTGKVSGEVDILWFLESTIYLFY